VRSGPLRGIGTATLQRARALPNMPTIAEQGLQGFEAYTWNMFFAPAKTPSAIVHKLNRELNATAKDPATREKLDRLGVDVVENSTPESLRNFVLNEPRGGQQRNPGLVRGSHDRGPGSSRAEKMF
jgi:tripartite-type tricarboxylate transporter receptor subunit TctC